MGRLIWSYTVRIWHIIQQNNAVSCTICGVKNLRPNHFWTPSRGGWSHTINTDKPWQRCKNTEANSLKWYPPPKLLLALASPSNSDHAYLYLVSGISIKQLLQYAFWWKRGGPIMEHALPCINYHKIQNTFLPIKFICLSVCLFLFIIFNYCNKQVCAV